MLQRSANFTVKTVRSFSYAFKGIAFLFKSESNSLIHLSAAIAAISAGIYFQIGPIKWAVVIICIGMVFTAELINTAIEKTIDIISPDFKPAAGMVKDIAAGAVLVAAACSLTCGIIIFYPYVKNLV